MVDSWIQAVVTEETKQHQSERLEQMRGIQSIYHQEDRAVCPFMAYSVRALIAEDDCWISLASKKIRSTCCKGTTIAALAGVFFCRHSRIDISLGFLVESRGEIMSIRIGQVAQESVQDATGIGGEPSSGKRWPNHPYARNGRYCSVRMRGMSSGGTEVCSHCLGLASRLSVDVCHRARGAELDWGFS